MEKSKDWINIKEIIINPDDPIIRKLVFLKNSEGFTSNMAILKGDLLPMRCNYTLDNLFFIVPFRGPSLVESFPVPNYPELIIKKIHFNDNKYVLELEYK